MRRKLHRTLLAGLAGSSLFVADALAPSAAPTPLPLGHQMQHSSQCSLCHGNHPSSVAMRDHAQREIGMFDLWRSSMMANAAVDPFWRATVSAEMALHPLRAAEIEQKCLRCHAPLASNEAHGDTDFRMSLERLDGTDTIARLGRDGVSCTVCHSMPADDLGDPSTYSGGFLTNGNDEIYGPHDNLFGGPMSGRTGLTPVQGLHINRSAVCGTCHTLFTKPLRADGTEVGVSFPEQTPYLEWRNSIYNDEHRDPRFEERRLYGDEDETRSCQDCHMPTLSADGRPIRTKVARQPNGFDYAALVRREPYGRHVFVGANTVVPQMLRDNAAALGITVPAAAFDATIAAARDQLQNRTAEVSFVRAERLGGDLVAAVQVVNLAGHKLPSAYPSRRAWLRVRVRDASRRVVWTSGEFDGAGRILDRFGSPLASEAAGGPLEPHRDRVVDPDRPQVWEAIMADESGAPTFSLMSATSYWKDDRLLPKGWSSSHPEAQSTWPHGVAGDPDFVGGADTVTFVIPAPAAGNPYEIEAELFYQTIAPRFAAELFTVVTPDVQAFQRYYNAAQRTPERVTGATAQVP